VSHDQVERRTFQELVLEGEETLHSGGNVVQVLAIGHAIANLISAEILVVPSQFGGGLLAN